MRVVVAAILLLFGLTVPASAQGLFGASPHQPPTDDRTGTNPLNLRHQVDVANTYVELEDLYLNQTTYRHVVPLFNRRLAISGSAPVVFGNLTGLTEGGLGDIAASVEWIPWLSRKGGLVAGFRTTWNTATVDALGLGVHTLMPYGQFVFQPSARTILAPFVAYRVGVGGDDFAPEVRDTLAGVSIVWRPSPRLWLSVQPQVIRDEALDATYGEASAEVGHQLLDRVSTYVRPSLGLGSDRTKPYTWGLTFGFRIVP